MENQIGLLTKIGAGLSALLGGAFGLGKYNAVLVKKKELYREDGAPIYLTVEKSKENIASCKTGMGKELAGINLRLDKINQHLVATNEERVKTANLMGRIEQFMENSKGK